MVNVTSTCCVVVHIDVFQLEDRITVVDGFVGPELQPKRVVHLDAQRQTGRAHGTSRTWSAER